MTSEDREHLYGAGIAIAMLVFIGLFLIPQNSSMEEGSENQGKELPAKTTPIPSVTQPPIQKADPAAKDKDRTEEF